MTRAFPIIGIAAMVLTFLHPTLMLILGIGTIAFAVGRHVVKRARFRGGPLPKVLHQWIALRAAQFIYDEGWSRMCAHGLAGSGEQGNCTKVALHRGAAAALTMGLTRNPKIADEVTHAVGTWMAAHRMVPTAFAGAGSPPWWNDQQMSKDNVIAVLLTAGGHHGTQPIEQALAAREQLLLTAGATESAPVWVRRLGDALVAARGKALATSRTTGGAR